MNDLRALADPSPVSHVKLLVPAEGTPSGRGALADLLRLMCVNIEERAVPDISVLVRRVGAGEALFREGLPAHSIYFVRSGTFKTLHTGLDGYEQVLGFYGKTEVLGFDAISGAAHPSEAVALEDSSVFVLNVHSLQSRLDTCPILARVVHRAVSEALVRQGEIADVMAAVAAEVRLARFLLNLSHRMLESGQSPHRFVLRMTRRDIGSYLGVAHETVSRSFTALAAWGLLTVANREVRIVDMEQLRHFSLGTRRQIDDASRKELNCAVRRAA
jgi:CRP/FNR family transcriptional regulator